MKILPTIKDNFLINRLIPKRRFLVFLFLFFSLVAVLIIVVRNRFGADEHVGVGMQNSNVPYPYNSVWGIITDSNLKPISNVSIIIGQHSTLTNEVGYYKLSYIPVGFQRFYAYKDGKEWISKDGVITVQILAGASSATNFTLIPLEESTADGDSSGDNTTGGTDTGTATDTGTTGDDATGDSTQSALVAYYPFDETSGVAVADASGNNHNGEAKNGSEPAKNGIKNYARQFTAKDQYIDFGSSSAFQLQNFTISGWYKYDSHFGPIESDPFTEYGRIISKKADNSNLCTNNEDSFNVSIQVIAYNNVLERPRLITCAKFINSGMGERIGKYVNDTSQQYLNNWYSFALVSSYDSSANVATLQLYINGQLKSTATQNSAPYTAQTNLTVGGNFKGTIDEIKIFNKALSAEEIKGL